MVVVSQESRKDQGSVGLSIVETDIASLWSGWLEKIIAVGRRGLRIKVVTLMICRTELLV